MLTQRSVNHHDLICHLETYEGFVIGLRENETFSICLVVSSQKVEMRKAPAPQGHRPHPDTARLCAKSGKERSSTGQFPRRRLDGTSPSPPAPAVCQNG